MRNVIVRYYANADVHAVRLFYSKTTYRNINSVSERDEVVVAFLAETMIGVFRLCQENGVYVLRRFNVLNEYQRKGIGSLMLLKLEEKVPDRECYLICKRQLSKTFKITSPKYKHARAYPQTP
jgi:GNAT superfamily N-acetyltransferase